MPLMEKRKEFRKRLKAVAPAAFRAVKEERAAWQNLQKLERNCPKLLIDTIHALQRGNQNFRNMIVELEVHELWEKLNTYQREAFVIVEAYKRGLLNRILPSAFDKSGAISNFNTHHFLDSQGNPVDISMSDPTKDILNKIRRVDTSRLNDNEKRILGQFADFFSRLRVAENTEKYLKNLKTAWDDFVVKYSARVLVPKMSAKGKGEKYAAKVLESYAGFSETIKKLEKKSGLKKYAETLEREFGSNPKTVNKAITLLQEKPYELGDISQTMREINRMLKNPNIGRLLRRTLEMKWKLLNMQQKELRRGKVAKFFMNVWRFMRINLARAGTVAGAAAFSIFTAPIFGAFLFPFTFGCVSLALGIFGHPKIQSKLGWSPKVLENQIEIAINRYRKLERSKRNAENLFNSMLSEKAQRKKFEFEFKEISLQRKDKIRDAISNIAAKTDTLYNECQNLINQMPQNMQGEFRNIIANFHNELVRNNNNIIGLFSAYTFLSRVKNEMKNARDATGSLQTQKKFANDALFYLKLGLEWLKKGQHLLDVLF